MARVGGASARVIAQSVGVGCPTVAVYLLPTSVTRLAGSF
jgi:hypothetical protein